MFNNEDRADMAMRIIDQFSDKNYTVPGEVSDGLRLDITDTIANLLHLADRFGLDHDDLIDKSLDSYTGDMEDGPPVKSIGEINAN